jgi:hypothetical protein
MRRALFLSLLLVGCATPDPSALTSPDLPTEDGFPYVAELVQHRCGTLDCHGSVGRNLRIYGDEGLRYSASDTPCLPEQTTTTEIQQDYESIVDLEPEQLTTVLAAGGADPQSLTFIAKPLGLESHMGGTVFQTGDDTYTCLTSWLEGQVATASCLAALPPLVCNIPAAESVEGASLDGGFDVLVIPDATTVPDVISTATGA